MEVDEKMTEAVVAFLGVVLLAWTVMVVAAAAGEERRMM